MGLTLSKRKIAVAILLCTILVGAVACWQMNQNAQAALLYPEHAGLVGWWQFDEGSGTIAKDSSENENNGLISGAVWVSGEFGQALSFDGASYVGSIGSEGFWQSLGEKTIIAWIYPTSFGSQEQIVGNRMDSNSPPIGFGFGLTSSGNLMTWTYPWADVISSLTPTLNSWNFVALTHQNTTITFYLNSQSETLTSQQQPSLGGGKLAIGQGGDAYPTERFVGTIDEVQIYSQALSTTEVQAIFQNGPDFSSTFLVKVPAGATQVIVTLSWQGAGSINAMISSPTQDYTESMIPMYQKTTYSTVGGVSSTLNIKRLSVAVSALPDDQDWQVSLTLDSVADLQISVETEK
jgi:hypothetical protein